MSMRTFETTVQADPDRKLRFEVPVDETLVAGPIRVTVTMTPESAETSARSAAEDSYAELRALVAARPPGSTPIRVPPPGTRRSPVPPHLIVATPPGERTAAEQLVEDRR